MMNEIPAKPPAVLHAGGRLIRNGQQTYYVVYLDSRTLYAELDEYLPSLLPVVNTVDELATLILKAFISSKCWQHGDYYHILDDLLVFGTREETQSVDTLVGCVEECIYHLDTFNPELKMVVGTASHVEVLGVTGDKIALKVIPKTTIMH